MNHLYQNGQMSGEQWLETIRKHCTRPVKYGGEGSYPLPLPTTIGERKNTMDKELLLRTSRLMFDVEVTLSNDKEGNVFVRDRETKELLLEYHAKTDKFIVDGRHYGKKSTIDYSLMTLTMRRGHKKGDQELDDVIEKLTKLMERLTHEA